VRRLIFPNSLAFLLISIIGFGAAAVFLLWDQIETTISAIEKLEIMDGQEVEAAVEFIISSNFGMTFFIVLLISFVISIFLISTLYFFAPLFVVLHDLSFWASLEASRQYAIKRFWDLFIFVLLIFLLNLAGVMLCCVGLVISIPVSYLALYNAFQDQIESESSL
jgi:hypothetical protein